MKWTYPTQLGSAGSSALGDTGLAFRMRRSWRLSFRRNQSARTPFTELFNSHLKATRKGVMSPGVRTAIGLYEAVRLCQGQRWTAGDGRRKLS
jgi:hypothetical protein